MMNEKCVELYTLLIKLYSHVADEKMKKELYIIISVVLISAFDKITQHILDECVVRQAVGSDRPSP